LKRKPKIEQDGRKKRGRHANEEHSHLLPRARVT
jgi:hypothetical protein